MNKASQSHVTLTHVWRWSKRTRACQVTNVRTNISSPEVRNWDGLKLSEILMMRQVSPLNNNRPKMSPFFRTSSLGHFLSLFSAVNPSSIISQHAAVPRGLLQSPPCGCSELVLENTNTFTSVVEIIWATIHKLDRRRVFVYVCIKRPRLSFLWNVVKYLLSSFLWDFKTLRSSSTLIHWVNMTFILLLVGSIMSNWWSGSFTCTKEPMSSPVGRFVWR